MFKLIKLWLCLVHWLSMRGIPLPLFRDYKTKQPSVSLTMMVISFLFCVFAFIGKIANGSIFGGLNFADSFNLFLATSGLYFGRQLSTKDGTIGEKISEPVKSETK